MKKALLVFVIALVAVVAVVITMWISSNNTVANKDLPTRNDEPDSPAFLEQVKNELSKEGFLTQRAEAIGLKRGIVKDQPLDPSLRPKAVKLMERQEEELAARLSKSGSENALLAAWTPIGPAPIPNGQTQTVVTPVSGRTIAIAIHPTNPNIVYVGTAQGGLYRTTDGGTNWTPIMDNALSLAIGAIAIAPSQPETVYVGTGEPNFSSDSFFGVGVYRIDNASTTANLSGPFNQDAGANDIFTGRAIGEIIVHPTDPNTIFVASTSGVGGLISASSALPSRGIYRSTNATSGTPTFAKLTGLLGNLNVSVHDIAIDPDDANVLIAIPIATGTNQGGIYRSANALNADPTTVTFSQRVTVNSTSTSVLNGELTAFQPAGTPDATFYAATGFSGNGRVYRSVDGGLTWTIQITNGFCGGQCFYDIAIAVDPTNVNNVYLGGSPNIIAAKSVNGGTTFVDNNLGLHVDSHALAVAPSAPTNVWLGTDGGIYKSTDSGLTWTPLNNTQFSATQFMGLDIHPTDANFTIGGTQDNGTNFYQPGGTWTRADFGDGGYAVIDQNAPDTTNVTMYHTYFNQTNAMGYARVTNVANATDGWETFYGCGFGGSTANGMTCTASAILFYAPMERGPGNPNTLYFGSDVLYRSSNSGVTMTKVSQEPITAGQPITAIGISPQNDNVRMVGLRNGGLFGTSTGTSPLTDLDPGNAIPNVAIARTVVDPTNQTTAYVTLSAFGFPSVYKTTTLNSLASNLAPTWTAAATGLPQIPVNAIVVDKLAPNVVYVGTDIGVYISTDGGANWAPFGTGLPRVAVFGMAITNAVPRQVRIATHGRGMFQIPAFVAPTAAAVSVSGRVLATNGRAVYRALVSAADQNGVIRTARTNQFGYFRFDDIPAGESYTFSVESKLYTFTPQVVNVQDNISNLNLIALP